MRDGMTQTVLDLEAADLMIADAEFLEQEFPSLASYASREDIFDLRLTQVSIRKRWGWVRKAVADGDCTVL